jgi:hypothetical protein
MRTNRAARLCGAATTLLIVLGTPALAGETDTPAPPTVTGPAVSQAPVSEKATPATPPPTPAKLDEPAKPDLTIAMAPQSRPFLVGEDFVIDVTVTNNGDADAAKVRASGSTKSGQQVMLFSGWDAFGTNEGTALGAHKSQVLHVKGRADDWKDADPVVRFQVQNDNDANYNDNIADVTIKFVPLTTKDTVGGVVYGDANDDGKFDDGEALKDVEIQLQANGVQQALKVRTDSAGRFDFRDVPARVYSLYQSNGPLPGGWITSGSHPIDADGSGKYKELRLRATQPLSKQLKASVKFNEGPYKVGDEAHLTVTLTNSGTKPVEHLIATCDRGGFPSRHLNGTDDPARWGELTFKRGGLTIGAGETRVLQVSGIVPDGTLDQGVVYVGCDFGPLNGEYEPGYPSVFALAKVPGKNGAFEGTFYNDKDGDNTIDAGEVVPDLEITLLDPLDGTQVAKAKTDAEGNLKFGGIPACWYVPVLSKGWKMKDNDFLPVIAVDNSGWAIQVVPDPDNSTPQPQPNTPVPAKKVAKSEPLANTGASVVGLTIGGVAVLVLGIGVVLFTCRRRRSS